MSTRTTTAVLGVLLLTLAALPTPAASEITFEAAEPAATTPDGLPVADDDPTGLADEFECALKHADTVGEMFWCFFGPPGP